MDPGHSVFEDQLNRHLTKCSARKQVPTDIWYHENLNLIGIKDKETSGNTVDDSVVDYLQWYAKLEKVWDSFLSKVEPERQVLRHKGLEKRLQQLENPKHATQQGSLIGHMERVGLLDNRLRQGEEVRDNVIVEFGCGRGELSRYVSKAQLFPTASDESLSIVYNKSRPRKYLLVDRAGPRMKFDSKLLKDYTEEDDDVRASVPEPLAERLRVDIKDLDLNKALETVFKPSNSGGAKSVSAISKHLCGCATDLTLECLAQNTILPNSSSDEAAVKSHRLEGIVIALCCRHVCSYETYPLRGREFLKEHGIASTLAEFKTLTKLTSWAVCGRRENANDTDTSHPSGLTVDQRERAGLLARRCLDYGRLISVRARGLEAQLYEYVAPEVSLENVALVARWP